MDSETSEENNTYIVLIQRETLSGTMEPVSSSPNYLLHCYDFQYLQLATEQGFLVIADLVNVSTPYLVFLVRCSKHTVA